MSARDGVPDYAQWIRDLEQKVAALQRGDALAGTVSVGKLQLSSGHTIEEESGGIRITNPSTGATRFLAVPEPEVVAQQVIRNTAIFHMPGALSVATSGPWKARYPLTVVEVTLDLGTFGGPGPTVEILLNGSPLTSTVVTAQSTVVRTDVTGRVLSTQLTPYVDVLTASTTDAGSGNDELVVQVGLA